MVAHLIRLKLAILRNSLKRSTGQLVGIIIGGLYGLGLLVLMLIGLAALAFAPIEVARTVLVLAGAGVVLGWLILPLLLSGIDLTLDPERFVTFAVPLPQLMVGLGLAGLLGIPGAVTLLAALGTVLAWVRHPVAAVAALIGALLAVATCVLGSRALTSLSSNLAGSRKFRDLSTLVVLIPLLLLGPIINGLSQGVSTFGASLPAVAEGISYTPLGAAWGFPADVAAGLWLQAGAKFLIAVATVVLLAWLWRASLARALVTPAHTGGRGKAAGRLGFFRLLPGTAWGAVMARSSTYFLRDPRYAASILIAPLLPLVVAVPGFQTGNFAALAFAGAIAVFLLAWSLATDTSYDGTAFALHLATGVSGFQDRLGRALGYALIAFPLGLGYTVLGAALSQQWAMLPAQLGLTIGIGLSGLGMGSVASAYFIFNVPAPGENPFKSRPGNNFAQGLLQMGGILALAVLVLPELVLTLLSFGSGSPVLPWVTFAVGLVLGSALLALGLWWGSKTYERRAPELLAQLAAQR